MLLIKNKSRRDVLKIFFRNTSFLIFGGLFADLGKKSMSFKAGAPLCIVTRFYSLKFPKKNYRSIDGFWSDHSEGNSLKTDINELPELALSRKRVSLKICDATGCPVSKVVYDSREMYRKHSSFLVKKYGLKVVAKNSSHITFYSEDFFAIDSIS